MPRYKYSTTRCTVLLDGEAFESWGISCSSECSPRLTVEDVSTDRAAVERAAVLFDRYQLSPLHLLDAVEDLLE